MHKVIHQRLPHLHSMLLVDPEVHISLISVHSGSVASWLHGHMNDVRLNFLLSATPDFACRDAFLPFVSFGRRFVAMPVFRDGSMTMNVLLLQLPGSPVTPQPPVGQRRMHVLRLLAAVLAASYMPSHSKLLDLGTMRVFWVHSFCPCEVYSALLVHGVQSKI